MQSLLLCAAMIGASPWVVTDQPLAAAAWVVTDHAAPECAESTPAVAARPRYPIRGNWWSGCPDYRHLTVGPHAGKFDVAWLKEQSNASIQSLHSDDHEGRVQWDYVVRGQAAEGRIAKAKTATSSCPGGVCPNGSVRTYSRWYPGKFLGR